MLEVPFRDSRAGVAALPNHVRASPHGRTQCIGARACRPLEHVPETDEREMQHPGDSDPAFLAEKLHIECKIATIEMTRPLVSRATGAQSFPGFVHFLVEVWDPIFIHIQGGHHCGNDPARDH